MRMLALGTDLSARSHTSGFTLLELLVVITIMAVATAGVSLAMRDGASAQLEREAQRLAALLESARAQSRMSASPVRWQATPTGFVFDGLSHPAQPGYWLGDDVQVSQGAPVLLGPEPVISPQQIRLTSRTQPERSLRISTDGVRPFTVQADDAMRPDPQ